MFLHTDGSVTIRGDNTYFQSTPLTTPYIYVYPIHNTSFVVDIYGKLYGFGEGHPGTEILNGLDNTQTPELITKPLNHRINTTYINLTINYTQSAPITSLGEKLYNDKDYVLSSSELLKLNSANLAICSFNCKHNNKSGDCEICNQSTTKKVIPNFKSYKEMIEFNRSMVQNNIRCFYVE
jgi:hypothetical protein